MSDIKLKLESPRSHDVRVLLEASQAALSAMYPTENNHFFDAERLSQPHVRFMVARKDGAAVGYGALVTKEDDIAELKSLYVEPSSRGLGLGRELLVALEAEARQIGVALIRLETGTKQTEAIGLYRKHGYKICDPFGSYKFDPLSVFMEKVLK